jgi:methylmalonyl-CoA mutase cobalamin-binding subunit
LLNKIGDMWSSGEIRVSHEHLASTVVRSLLGSMMSAIRLDDSAPRFIVTTPSGQFHEFGALMAAVTAASLGWKVVYLGPNMPAEDIAQAARDSRAPVIGLSLVYPVDDPGLETEFRKLRHLLGDEIIVVVGGRAVQGYDAIIKELGLLKIRNLDDLRSQLEAIRSAMRVGKTAGVRKAKNNESIH